jgi:hypothetical protein
VEIKEARSWRGSYPGESDWDSCSPPDSVSVAAVHAWAKGCDNRVRGSELALGRGVAPVKIFVNRAAGGAGAGVATVDGEEEDWLPSYTGVSGMLLRWGWGVGNFKRGRAVELMTSMRNDRLCE